MEPANSFLRKRSAAFCPLRRPATKPPRFLPHQFRGWVCAAICLIAFAGQLRAQSLLSALEREIQSLVKLAKPSVVTVVASKTTVSKSGRGLLSIFGDRQNPEEEIMIGTGLIVSSDGFILTKESVIREAQHIQVTLDNGETHHAELVERDSARAIAVLKVQASELTPARLGSGSDLHPGSWVAVIGNFFGVPHSVSIGVVSAIQPHGRIQITAQVDPGSSGSPVFGAEAEAVGLVAGRVSLDQEAVPNSSILSHTALVYSLYDLLPFVRRVVADYYATHGWIGVTVVTDSNTSGRPRILRLTKAGPGHLAGLQIGDIITHVAGEQVDSLVTLARLIARTRPGQEVPIRVLRLGKKLTRTVRVAQRKPVALAELETHESQDLAVDQQVTPASRKKTRPRLESTLLNRRIEALEKELRALRNLYQSQLMMERR